MFASCSSAKCLGTLGKLQGRVPPSGPSPVPRLDPELGCVELRSIPKELWNSGTCKLLQLHRCRDYLQSLLDHWPRSNFNQTQHLFVLARQISHRPPFARLRSRVTGSTGSITHSPDSSLQSAPHRPRPTWRAVLGELLAAELLLGPIHVWFDLTPYQSIIVVHAPQTPSFRALLSQLNMTTLWIRVCSSNFALPVLKSLTANALLLGDNACPCRPIRCLPRHPQLLLTILLLPPS